MGELLNGDGQGEARFPLGHCHKIKSAFVVLHGHINRGLFTVRLVDHAAGIFQHNNGLDLGVIPSFHSLVAAHNGLALFGAQIGVLKQADLHGIFDDPGAGRAQALNGGLLAIGFNIALDGLVHNVIPLAHAHLVHAGFQQEVMALHHVQILNAIIAHPVGGNAVIGADHAVKAQLVPEQVCDDVLVVAGAHGGLPKVGPVAVIEDGIRRHNRSRAPRFAGEVEGLLEGQQVGVQLVTGINVPLAVFPLIVGLAAALIGAIPGEVLHNGVDAVLAPTQIGPAFIIGGLHPVDQGRRHVHDQLGVLTEGFREPVIPGIGCHVDLGKVGRGNAQVAVFLCVPVRAHQLQLRVEGGGHAQVAGPGGNPADAGFGVRLNRNRKIQRLHICLDHVYIGHGRFDGGRHIVPKGPHTVVNLILDVIAHNPGTAGAVKLEVHQAGALFQRHLGRQILRPRDIVQPPVLVGVQFAVFVHVLEGVPTRLEQLYAGVGGIAQGGPILVGHFDPAVGGRLLGPLHVAGAKLLQLPGAHLLGGKARRLALRRVGALRAAAVAAGQQGQQQCRSQQHT